MASRTTTTTTSTTITASAMTLETLPNEVIWLVTDNLDRTAHGQLRLTSRTLYAQSTHPFVTQYCAQQVVTLDISSPLDAGAYSIRRWEESGYQGRTRESVTQTLVVEVAVPGTAWVPDGPWERYARHEAFLGRRLERLARVRQGVPLRGLVVDMESEEAMGSRYEREGWEVTCSSRSYQQAWAAAGEGFSLLSSALARTALPCQALTLFKRSCALCYDAMKTSFMSDVAGGPAAAFATVDSLDLTVFLTGRDMSREEAGMPALGTDGAELRSLIALCPALRSLRLHWNALWHFHRAFCQGHQLRSTTALFSGPGLSRLRELAIECFEVSLHAVASAVDTMAGLESFEMKACYSWEAPREQFAVAMAALQRNDAVARIQIDDFQFWGDRRMWRVWMWVAEGEKSTSLRLDGEACRERVWYEYRLGSPER